jgi:uncharacterized membrane protein YvlD (DUF360 family)
LFIAVVEEFRNPGAMNETEIDSGFRSLARHAVAIVFVEAVALFLLAWILPGFRIDGFWGAILTAAVIGLLNSLIWPVISRFALKLTVATLGLAGLLLNALIVAGVMLTLPWLKIDGIFEALVITILLTVITSIAGSILAFDDDSLWYLETVRRIQRRNGYAEETAVPGIVFFEIDGLAHEVLMRALINGNAPTLSRWVRSGKYRLEGWETDWSSQTGACQAGILHGNNGNMPAFRWWDKGEHRAMVTNHPKDAAEIERRQSDGKGLLADDGASRANILSGDAPYCQLTMSTVLEPRGKALGTDYAAYFARPFAVVKTAAGTVAEIVSERISAIRARRAGIDPAIKRSSVYAVMRAWATVIQLDLQVAVVTADVLAGRKAIYTTFLAYDEVAHHSGIERPETLSALRKVDRAIERIVKAASLAPRPYRFVVLSDHGQSQGKTFLDRYGLSLEDLVSNLAAVRAVSGPNGDDEARGYLKASLKEASEDESFTGRTIRATAGEKIDSAWDEPSGEPRKTEEVSVMASGNLGLISFTGHDGRASREWIEENHPGLIDGLVSHDGIGFLLVRSSDFGPQVIGAEGVRNLETGTVTGLDPLEPFGPNAAEHVLRTDGFENCPDIVINSTYWPELNEVAAFEELVGSHGGMGGPQSHPFVLHPVDFEWPAHQVVGAEQIHWILKDWINGLSEDQGSVNLEPGSMMHTSVSGA